MIIKSKIEGTPPRPNYRVFTKKLHLNLITLWRDATWAFVKAVTNAIHIDTGMSAASLLPLAEQLRAKGILRTRIMGGVKSGPKLGYQEIGAEYVPGLWKSIPEGERRGRDAFVLEYGDRHTGLGWRFDFRIVILQYKLWEPQWATLVDGQNAFMDFIKTYSRRYLDGSLRWLLIGTFVHD